MRIGSGYDIHRMIPGRKLVLGGVVIPFEKGLLGHSDADVLVHAVCDALMGAAALGDIGVHFPDTDPKFKDANSLTLLAESYRMVRNKRFEVENIDATIFAEAPKLSPYREAMQSNIGKVLQIDPERINIKATTTEGLGAIGKGEGIAAMCVVLIHKKE